jgi:hypothetical protein
MMQKLDYIHFNPVRADYLLTRRIIIIRLQNFITKGPIILKC